MDSNKYIPRPPTMYPLGKSGRVTQREMYMAMTDFEGRKLVAEVTDTVLAAAQGVRDALGVNGLSYGEPGTP